MNPFGFLLYIKSFERPGIEIPEAQPDINIKHSADPNTCAVCFCLGYSAPFVSDSSPKSIDREGLGESRTETRQTRST